MEVGHVMCTCRNAGSAVDPLFGSCEGLDIPGTTFQTLRLLYFAGTDPDFELPRSHLRISISTIMAPAGTGVGLSAKRQQFAGPTGLKGIVHNGRTSAIALFASLGGLVYGCKLTWTMTTH